jgi:hypothetical protein
MKKIISNYITLGMLVFISAPLYSMEGQINEPICIKRVDGFAILHHRIQKIENYIARNAHKIPLEEQEKAVNELRQARLSLERRLKSNNNCLATNITALFAAKNRIALAERILKLPHKPLQLF